MTNAILACVDGSGYEAGVCDYAAWLAGRANAEIQLLHAREGKPVRPAHSWMRAASPSPLSYGERRLQENGLEGVRPLLVEGPFIEAMVAAGRDARLIVLGKRGTATESDRGGLGANIAAAISSTDRPVCLAARTFLPIHRALVLIDSDPEHQRTVNLLADELALSGLHLNLLMIDDGAHDGARKLAWARARLQTATAEVSPLTASGPRQAVRRYLESGRIDLLILSRELAAAGFARLLDAAASHEVWSLRAPVLVC